MEESFNLDAFAIDVFRKLWYISHMTITYQPRPLKFQNLSSPDSLCESAAQITWCRSLLYKKPLEEIIRYNYENFSKSTIDFYLFLKNNVEKIIPIKELYIFDKLFMTLAFTLEMCYWSVMKGDNSFLIKAPDCWVMYFDTDLNYEFFYEGGWKTFEWYNKSCKSSKFFSCIGLVTQDMFYYGNADVRRILLNALEDYDKRYFKECVMVIIREYDIHALNCCRPCYPLFYGLKCLADPSMDFIIKKLMIEGYIQILLNMPSDEEMIEFKESVIDVLKSELPDIFGADIQPDEQVKVFSSVEKDFIYLEKRRLKEKRLKEAAAQHLMELLFVDRRVLSDTQSDTSTDGTQSNKLSDAISDDCKSRCMFCDEDVILKTIRPREESDKIKLIKSVISKTVKNTNEKEIKDNAGEDVYTKTEKSENSHTICIVSSEAEARDEKDALQMFLALGVEPGRSAMLNTLRKKTFGLAAETLAKPPVLESNCVKKKKKKKKKKPKNSDK